MVVLSAAALLGLLVAAGGEPICGTSEQGLRFASEVQDRLRCERRVRREGGDLCAPSTSACRDSVERVVELVYGGAPPGESVAPRRCRNAIRKATQRFVLQRTKELVFLGRRRATRASDFVGAIVEGCGDALAAGSLPVGGVCADLPAASSTANVAFCLRGRLEEIVQAASGVTVVPNFLFILTDDQRWDTMEFMPLTRALVSERGLEFTESFVVTSLCCPDRATILTGLYAHEHGLTTNKGALGFDHQRDTIARRLQTGAGYRTALLGKYLLNTRYALGRLVPPGWDEWHVFLGDLDLYYGYLLNQNGVLKRAGLGERAYSTDRLAGFGRTLMSRWADEPWFVYYAPFAPHWPPRPPKRHAGKFDDLPPFRPPSFRAKAKGQKPKWVVRAGALLALAEAEPKKTDERRRLQLEALLAVDDAVAGFSMRLEALGLTDNTVLVYTSDNGLPWLEHGLRTKNNPYEESIRVPLAIRYPKRIHVPRIIDELVQPIDFYPTFTELADVEAPPVHGRSLVPFFAGGAIPWREDILLEHFGGAGVAPSRGVRTRRWKLIETDTDAGGIDLELYDLAADPYELENLAARPEHARLIERLRTRIGELVAQ